MRILVCLEHCDQSWKLFCQGMTESNLQVADQFLDCDQLAADGAVFRSAGAPTRRALVVLVVGAAILVGAATLSLVVFDPGIGGLAVVDPGICDPAVVDRDTAACAFLLACEALPGVAMLLAGATDLVRDGLANSLYPDSGAAATIVAGANCEVPVKVDRVDANRGHSDQVSDVSATNLVDDMFEVPDLDNRSESACPNQVGNY